MAPPSVIRRFLDAIQDTISVLEVARSIAAEVYLESAPNAEVEMVVTGEGNRSLEAGRPGLIGTKPTGKRASPVPMEEVVNEGLFAVWPYGALHRMWP